MAGPVVTTVCDATAGGVFSVGRTRLHVSVWNRLDAVDPTTLIVVGVILVVIPEPATSALGAGLTLLGIAWWISWWED